MSFQIGVRSGKLKDKHITEDTTQLLLEELIEQVKLTNLYLSRLAGEELDEQDIGIE